MVLILYSAVPEKLIQNPKRKAASIERDIHMHLRPTGDTHSNTARKSLPIIHKAISTFQVTMEEAANENSTNSRLVFCERNMPYKAFIRNNIFCFRNSSNLAQFPLGLIC